MNAASAATDFWSDNLRAQRVLKERTELTAIVESIDTLAKDLQDLQELTAIADNEHDEQTGQDLVTAATELVARLGSVEISRLLNEPVDKNNAILSISSGAGGTESQDWAEMLLRMYTRWCERNGYRTEVVDFQAGDEAGVKGVTVTVEGLYAYGYLKAERGIHRLVRISPFDAAARRHTSFAAVFVMPELDESIEVDIKPEELRIDVFRAGGKGGQHVNKTESAVRMTHLPTGIVVQCQNERSQHKNRSIAMKILRSRLYEHQRAAREKQIEEQFHSDKREIAWGSQIRSYVLAPYRLVKDHRTGVERGDVDRVLDGDLTEFMKAYLLTRQLEKRPG